VKDVLGTVFIALSVSGNTESVVFKNYSIEQKFEELHYVALPVVECRN
jgi:hypothetical protein